MAKRAQLTIRHESKGEYSPPYRTTQTNKGGKIKSLTLYLNRDHESYSDYYKPSVKAIKQQYMKYKGDLHEALYYGLWESVERDYDEMVHDMVKDRLYKEFITK